MEKGAVEKRIEEIDKKEANNSVTPVEIIERQSLRRKMEKLLVREETYFLVSKSKGKRSH